MTTDDQRIVKALRFYIAYWNGELGKEKPEYHRLLDLHYARAQERAYVPTTNREDT